MNDIDPIAAARAMIEPLTGYTSGPWDQVSAGDNGYHIGSGGWTVDASDPDGGYFDEYHICQTTGYYDAAGADARLIAAAPALRDTVADLADLADAQAQEIARLQAALRPFSDAAAIKLCGEWQDHQSISRTDTAFHITFGHLRAARAVLGETP